MLAQRLLLLNHGELIFDGKPQTLFTNDALLDAGGLEKPAASRFTQCFPALFLESVILSLTETSCSIR